MMDPVLLIPKKQYGTGTAKGKKFIMDFKTTGAAESIALPLVSGGTYNFLATWGDGTADIITAWDDAAKTHEYAAAGTYRVVLEGTVTGWAFANGGSCAKLVNIIAWGPLKLTTDNGAFYGCSNMECSATDAPDLSATNTTLNQCFRNCSKFNGAIGNWDTSAVVSFYYMFVNCTVFNQDIGDWDTSNVKEVNPYNTAYMFSGCTAFNQDISDWNLSNNRSMIRMFQNCTSFNQDLSKWAGGGESTNNLRALTDATDMFVNVTLDTANYDALLIALAADAANLQVEVALHMGGSKYTRGGAAEAAYTTLTAGAPAEPRWTITDGGLP